MTLDRMVEVAPGAWVNPVEVSSLSCHPSEALGGGWVVRVTMRTESPWFIRECTDKADAERTAERLALLLTGAGRA